MPLDPDVAGELGRYLTVLENALEGVQQDLRRVRAELRQEQFEAQILAGLSAGERDLLLRFTGALDRAGLVARRDVLVAERDVLVKVIGLVRGQLNG